MQSLQITEESLVTRSQDDGFSLVEMLVSLAILGMLGTIMSSFAVQLRLLDSRSTAMAYKNEVDVVSRYISELAASAVEQAVRIRSGQPVEVFLGQNEKIRFIANSRASSINQGLRDVQIYLAESEAGAFQILQENNYHSPSSATLVAAADSIVLLDAVQSLRFQFSNGPEQIWIDQWEKTSRLPYSIRTSISYTLNGQEVTLSHVKQMLNNSAN